MKSYHETGLPGTRLPIDKMNRGARSCQIRMDQQPLVAVLAAVTMRAQQSKKGF